MTKLIECPYCFENIPGGALQCQKCNNRLPVQEAAEETGHASDSGYQLYQDQSPAPTGPVELYPPLSDSYGYESSDMHTQVNNKSSTRLIIGIAAAVTVITLSVTALYLLYFQEQQEMASGDIPHVVIDNVPDQERNSNGSTIFLEVPDDLEPDLPPEPIPVPTPTPPPNSQTPAPPPDEGPKPPLPTPSVVEPEEPGDQSDETGDPDVVPATMSITWNDGQYAGPLKNGVPHGHGSWVHFTGKTYTGEFREGSITGYGNMVFPGGEVYTGHFKDGVAHGFGTMSHPDGRTVSGNWVEGIYQGD